MASVLGQAALRRDWKRVKLCLERRSRRAMTSTVADRDAFTGWMPLHCAAAAGSPRIAKALLEAGVEDIDDQDPLQGETALHIAARNGYLKVCQLLLKCGADPTVENKGRVSPLRAACEAGRLDAVRMILDNDASEEHDLILCMGEARDWNFGEKVETELLLHQKKYKDLKTLKEMRSFLRR